MSTSSDFAIRYTAAWCSKSAASVAAHFAERGSLAINGGEPAIGRAAITAAAQGFMSAFPDMWERSSADCTMKNTTYAGNRMAWMYRTKGGSGEACMRLWSMVWLKPYTTIAAIKSAMKK